MDVDPLSSWVLRDSLTTYCGLGHGMAACASLGLVVTSSWTNNTLSVFAMPQGHCHTGDGDGDGDGGGLQYVSTLGLPPDHESMRFNFRDDDLAGTSGWMAFTSDGPSLLLVTDHGHGAVHIIDVVSRTHVGYVGGLGSIAGPRGVATRGSMAAVSCWVNMWGGDYPVRLFEGGGASWVHVRTIVGAAPGTLHVVYGLRFTADGTGVVMMDAGNGRVSLYRVADGTMVRHLATGLHEAMDVEECGEGVMVTRVDGRARAVAIEFASDARGACGQSRPRLLHGDGVRPSPSALALVPGLGLVVRDNFAGGRVQVYATPAVIAMATMSLVRVGWMGAVARARPAHPPRPQGLGP
jgi:hypothetical protein